MPFLRAVCLSSLDPASPSADVLGVCHNFPDRKSQSGISGKLINLGEQFVFLLECPETPGKPAPIESLIRRIQQHVPEAGLTVRQRGAGAERAFASWAIEEVYADEIGHRDLAAGATLRDLIIDLLAGDGPDTELDTEPEAEADAAARDDSPEAPKADADADAEAAQPAAVAQPSQEEASDAERRDAERVVAEPADAEPSEAAQPPRDAFAEIADLVTQHAAAAARASARSPRASSPSDASPTAA